MPDEKKMWNYFTPSEVKNLDIEFVAKLDMARHRAMVPFVISSGYRTPEHNFEVGGVDGSAHTKGKAVDLIARDSKMLWHILDGLYSVGFKRIGVYFMLQGGVPTPSHVHVDSDDSMPYQNVTWLKLEGTIPPTPRYTVT